MKIKYSYNEDYKWYYIKSYRYNADWEWTGVGFEYEEIEILLIRRKK